MTAGGERRAARQRLPRLVPWMAAAAALLAAGQPPGPAPAARRAPLWGVTLDDVSHLGQLLPALAGLPARPTIRVYFNVREPARYYTRAVRRISMVGTVLGELLDSSDETAISVAGVRARAAGYLRALGRRVGIWEIGNEVNGSWTGSYRLVAARLAGAFDVVHAAGGRTALTLYANMFGPDHCGDGPGELTPAQFSRRYVPARIAAGLSYVFLSYYPSQCGGREPSGARLAGALRQLHAIYPHALLGFGEVGLPRPATRTSLRRARQVMRWAYALNPRLPYYAGGYFWWYAAEDALRPGAVLGRALRAAFRAESAALGPARTWPAVTSDRAAAASLQCLNIRDGKPLTSSNELRYVLGTQLLSSRSGRRSR